MNDTVKVPLTQGKEAIIDARFAPDVITLKWYSRIKGKNCYGIHHLSKAQRAYHHGTAIPLHRFIYELAFGPIPSKMEIDHINGNGLDNRLCNLRLVTTRKNQNNQYRHRNGRLPGTYYDVDCTKRPWRATLEVNGESKILGYFTTEEAAHEAYCEATQNL